MRKLYRPTPLTIMFICVLTMLVRVDGMHLHLCFDGEEPPFSIHTLDATSHHFADGTSALHDDVDLIVSEDTLSKSRVLSDDLSVVALLAFVSAIRVFVTNDRFTVVYRVGQAPNSKYLLHPPLRAPPSQLFS